MFIFCYYLQFKQGIKSYCFWWLRVCVCGGEGGGVMYEIFIVASNTLCMQSLYKTMNYLIFCNLIIYLERMYISFLIQEVCSNARHIVSSYTLINWLKFQNTEMVGIVDLIIEKFTKTLVLYIGFWIYDSNIGSYMFE